MKIKARNFGSPLFLQITRGLVALQTLELRGMSDSQEADAVRDSLDGPLAAAGEAERNRAQWLSDDLYSVGLSAREPKDRNPQAQSQLTAALEARQAGDWDRALGLLRRWKDYLAPDVLSYSRGSIWLAAGVPEVAGLFLAHARRLAPSEGGYHVMHLHALDLVDPVAAADESRHILEAAKSYEPTVVTLGAQLVLKRARSLPAYEAAPTFRATIPVLVENLARIEAEPADSVQRNAAPMTMALLGACHQSVGESDISARYYSLGLGESPDNVELLTARGMLLYGKSTQAVRDLERAVELGTPHVWPYLFLAHHYLLTGRFDACRATCEAGLRLPAADEVRSVMEELRGVALAELEFPSRYVREAFEAALRLDPGNEQARRNLAAFEAARARAAPAAPSKWGTRTGEEVRGYASSGNGGGWSPDLNMLHAVAAI